MTVQACVQDEQDGQRQRDAGGTENLQFQAECQNSDNCVGNRCGSHCVCMVKATSTVFLLLVLICECDEGFELMSTARVAVYQLPLTMLITCSRMPLSLRKLSSVSVISSVTADSRREICRTTSGARPREHFAKRAVRSQRTPSIVSTS